MNAAFFKKLLPHIIAIAIFAIVAIVYCKPALDGKVLNQHDTQGWRGMAQQSLEVKEKTGKFPLWTNSMFSGMPTYQIALAPDTKIGEGIETFRHAFSLWLPEPIAFFFLASLCFYILCLVAGSNTVVAIFGGLAYAYSTYNPIIVSVGHITKMVSIAYAPIIIAGILLLYDRKYLIGFLLTALFGAITIAQNHLQIVYYLIIVAFTIAVAYFVKAYKEKQLLHFAKASVLAMVAGLVGLGVCAGSIMPTYDYAKDTMRGGVSQLTLPKPGEPIDSTASNKNKTKGGLDKDYALRWSVGPMETFTFIVPGLYGGSNGGKEHTAAHSKMVEKFAEIGVPEESAIGATNGYSYWGSMSKLSETTSGPVYLGAVICFLFIFGLFYVNTWHKWWIVAASVIGILLAWGSNFMAFNSFLLDHLPFYSKFRAPSMALVIPQFCIPFMAVLAVSKLVNEIDLAAAFKKLRLSVIATGAVVVILALFWLMADYTGKGDADIKNGFTENFSRSQPGQAPNPEMLQQAEQLSKDLMSSLRADRKSEAGGDLLRSVLFIAVAVVITGLLAKKKLSPTIAVSALTLLSLIDLITVDNRYLSYDNYRDQEEVSDAFIPSPADRTILADPDHANFRVFNQTGSFTTESVTSYHHNSIGGYHPAKLGLYQDIIEYQLSKGNMSVFNMLNAKYFIMQDQAGRPVAQLNTNAFGPCWLVKGVKFVSSPDNEMLALDNTNLRDTAVVNDTFKKDIAQLPQYDSTATLKISERQNDKITYAFNAATPQFAVFSEVYYNRGWDAFIDGKKVPYVKTNYVLRGLAVPAGKHTIEFNFEPRSYYLGNSISFWCTILIYLLAIATIVYYVRNKKTAGIQPANS
ncbi:YfhO family protein [Ferruginibacter sp.]